MNTTTIYLTANYNVFPNESTSATIYTPTYTIKGASTVNLNLTGVDETKFFIGKLIFDWGDQFSSTTGTEIFYLGIAPLTATSIVNTDAYSHYYLPPDIPNTYFINTSAIVTLFYDESASTPDHKISIVVPLRIAKGSIYDNVESISLLNSQILPTVSSSSLLNFIADKNTYTMVSILSN